MLTKQLKEFGRILTFPESHCVAVRALLLTRGSQLGISAPDQVILTEYKMSLLSFAHDVNFETYIHTRVRSY